MCDRQYVGIYIEQNEKYETCLVKTHFLQCTMWPYKDEADRDVYNYHKSDIR